MYGITRDQAIQELKRRGNDVSQYIPSNQNISSISRQDAINELKKRGLDVSQYNSEPTLTKDQAIAEAKRRGLDISQYLDTKQPTQQPKQDEGLLGDIGNIAATGLEKIGDFPADIAAGGAQFLQGVINTPANVTNYLAQKNVLPSSFYGKVPKMAPQNYFSQYGVANPNLIDKSIAGLTQFAPAILAGGETLPGQVAAATAEGATQSTNPVAGSLASGSSALAGGAIGKSLEGVGSALSKIMPLKAAKNIMQDLGKGRGADDNSRSIASDINSQHSILKDDGGKKFSDAFGNNGSKNIYDIDGDNGTGYNSIDSDITNSYYGNIKKAHNNFVKNPSLDNAHILQSELGYGYRDLKKSDDKGNLSIIDKKTMHNYKDVRDLLNGDIHSFLNTISDDASSKYSDASKNWFDNVVPYIGDNKISKISKGAVKNPSNVTNIFSHPEDDVLHVVNDGGDDLKNKIIYSDFLNIPGTFTPEKLLNRYNDLDRRGLSSYITQDLADSMEKLDSSIKARNIAQLGSGSIGGAILGSKFGVAGAGAGGVEGAILTKPLMASLSKLTSSSKAMSSIAKATKNMSPIAVDSLKKLLIASSPNLAQYMTNIKDNGANK